MTGLDVDEQWLDVARKASVGSGLRIDWRCGNASSLPFPSDSFDVVLCQQGLQFFDDRKSAVHEMCRVLARDGRLGASVFRSIDRSPGYSSLARALGRHVGPKAEAFTQKIFSLGDPDVLRSLMQSEGFRHIEVRPTVRNVHFRSVEDFPHVYALGWEAPPAITKAVIDDVARDLRKFEGAHGVTFPMEALLATATK